MWEVILEGGLSRSGGGWGLGAAVPLPFKTLRTSHILKSPGPYRTVSVLHSLALVTPLALLAPWKAAVPNFLSPAKSHDPSPASCPL